MGRNEMNSIKIQDLFHLGSHGTLKIKCNVTMRSLSFIYCGLRVYIISYCEVRSMEDIRARMLSFFKQILSAKKKNGFGKKNLILFC